jgi:threonine synthase
VADGAVPFTCQGPQNGLCIDGGTTIAFEMLDQAEPPEHVVVQVGGGALASAVAEVFARRLNDREPVFHAVQTAGGFPLARAYERVAKRLRQGPLDLALHLAMEYARTHRSEFMEPWPETPRSVATGILDDETYDWAAVVEAVHRTGGTVQVVTEARLEEANAKAFATTGIPADHTGTAGLAGLLSLREAQLLVGDDERVAVLFTGARRPSVDELGP